MLDPKLVRETPDLVRAAIARKHLAVDLDPILAVDAAWRTQLREVELLRASQKAANNAMAALPKGSPEFIAKVQEMKAVSAQVKERDALLKATEEKFREAMLALPNLPHASVPDGAGPADNVVHAQHGDPAAVGRTPSRTGRFPASTASSTSPAARRSPAPASRFMSGTRPAWCGRCCASSSRRTPWPATSRSPRRSS